MKIVIDSAIPFVKALFEPYAEVCYTLGAEITPDLIRDADALIIRTRTRCDKALLEGSSVKVIISATIGYDHIDLDYCKGHGISISTARGCNARGVLQWISAALALLSKSEGWSPQEMTIGIVGVGSVGSLIEEYCLSWGFRVLRCDPPRGESEEGFIPLEELLPRVDILSLHTPLDETTYHLINRDNIGLLKPSATIINTSRGECIETQALLDNPQHKLLLDVWEGEPRINPELLQRAIISTPHIAGYSIEGKANGSAMSVNSLARHLDIAPLMDWYPNIQRNVGSPISWEELCNSVDNHFDIEAESERLKSSPEEFESIRNNYNYRKEFF